MNGGGMNAHTPVTDNIAELSTGKIFYRDSGGSGVPVIFLHAASGSSMLWEHQIPAFTQAGFRFIAIDYRGVDGASGAGDWSDPIDELLTRLAVDRFHLLGTAAGGGTALQYALGYMNRLRSIIIANSHGNVQDADYLDMGKRMRPPAFDALPVDLRELGPSYRAANPEGVARWLALSSPVRPSANTRKPPSLSAARTVTWARLEALKLPVLLVTGDADLYTPPSVLRLFARHIRHAESTIIPETGHSSYWESPELFNRTVLEFIRKH